MKLKFTPGDIIKNKKPYKGEQSRLIISFDKYGYICVKRFDGDWYFGSREHIFFDDCEKYYDKIDHVKIKLDVTVEE